MEHRQAAEYAEDLVRENYRKLTELLIGRGLTITTMESITAGQIASLITDTEGSSAVLEGAFVTYSNRAKIMQGGPGEIIDRFSVYSEQTACAMAQACRDAYGADIGIGTSGTAGNIDPANPEVSSVGRLYFAISMGEETRAYSALLPPMKNRLAYKLAAAQEVYLALMSLLAGENIYLSEEK